MLRRFEIDNFKSYRNARLELGGGETGDWPLTVLIGANASGKTNLIEGLRLLSSIAGGARLDDITPGRTDAGLRGSVAGLVLWQTANQGFTSCGMIGVQGGTREGP